MKRLAFALALAASPVVAEDEGATLMQRGLELFFEGLITEAEPTIEEFRNFAEEVGPELQQLLQEARPMVNELLGMVDDLNNYQAPERLPNGDIIIRRRPDAPAWQPEPKGIDL